MEHLYAPNPKPKTPNRKPQTLNLKLRLRNIFARSLNFSLCGFHIVHLLGR
jgi:hypothetical protein